MNIVAYLRVVPSDNARQALDHQKERIETFSRQQGWQMISVFEEVSRADLALAERPRLMEAIACTDSGMALVVVRLDRLSSQTRLLEEIVEALALRGAVLKAVQGSSDPKDIRPTLEITNSM